MMPKVKFEYCFVSIAIFKYRIKKKCTFETNVNVSVVPSAMTEYHRGILSLSVYVTDNVFIHITVVIKQFSRQTI